MENSVPYKHSTLGDFFSGAFKGFVTCGLLMGAMWLVFAGLPVVGIPATMPSMLTGLAELPNLVGILLTSGLVNGALKAHHGAQMHHEISTKGPEAALRNVDTSPTMIPLLGLEHGVAADHALEVEHNTHSRTWAKGVVRNGDRVQEILDNGSLSDKDRAAAILAEREQLASMQPGISS